MSDVLPYGALLLVVLCLARLSAAVSSGYTGLEKSDKRWNPFDALLALTLIVFMAARLDVGTDWSFYLSVFQRLDPQQWEYYLETSPQEFGFTGLSLAVKRLTDAPYAIFWVAAVLTVLPVLNVLSTRKQFLPFAIFLYCTLGMYLAPFNVVRQGIAVALVFWATAKFKGWKFVAIVAIATLFHGSAAIAGVIIFVVQRFQPTARLLGIITAAGLASATVFPSLVPALDFLGLLNERYLGYLATDVSGAGTYLIIASRLALLTVTVWLARDAPADVRRWVSVSLMSLPFLILGTQSVTLGRVALFFDMFMLLSLPYLLGRAKGASRGLTPLVVVGCLIYAVVYLQNFGDLLPYRTYLSL